MKGSHKDFPVSKSKVIFEDSKRNEPNITLTSVMIAQDISGPLMVNFLQLR